MWIELEDMLSKILRSHEEFVHMCAHVVMKVEMGRRERSLKRAGKGDGMRVMRNTRQDYLKRGLVRERSEMKKGRGLGG